MKILAHSQDWLYIISIDWSNDSNLHLSHLIFEKGQHDHLDLQLPDDPPSCQIQWQIWYPLQASICTKSHTTIKLKCRRTTESSTIYFLIVWRHQSSIIVEEQEWWQTACIGKVATTKNKGHHQKSLRAPVKLETTQKINNLYFLSCSFLTDATSLHQYFTASLLDTLVML